MSYTVQQLLSLAGKFEELADDSLSKTAAEKKNKDPKKKGKFPFWLMKKKPKASEKDTEESKKDTKPSAKNKEVKKDKKKKSAYYDAILAKFGAESDDPNFPFKPQIPKSLIELQNKLKGHGWTGKKIDPVLQTMLGVAADGKLGQNTQAALNKYKETLGWGKMDPTDTKLNDMAFAAMKNENEYLSKSKMLVDPKSGLYISHAPGNSTPAKPEADWSAPTQTWGTPSAMKDIHDWEPKSPTLADPWVK